jgi:hypothetical protein
MGLGSVSFADSEQALLAKQNILKVVTEIHAVEAQTSNLA